MPRAPRRCSKLGCKNYSPCGQHQAGWSRERPNYKPLPHNWSSFIVPKVKLRDKGRCRLRMDGCTGRGTEVDHVIPRFVRDDHSFSNLMLVCESCHKLKGRQDLAKYKGYKH